MERIMGHYDNLRDLPPSYWEKWEKEWEERLKRHEDFKEFQNHLDVALKYDNDRMVVEVLLAFMDSYLFEHYEVSWG
jgi:hypothetical protein